MGITGVGNAGHRKFLLTKRGRSTGGRLDREGNGTVKLDQPPGPMQYPASSSELTKRQNRRNRYSTHSPIRNRTASPPGGTPTMARSALKAPAVLRVITAAVAVVVLTAVPASARSAAFTGAAAPASPAPCQAADLGIGVPSAIAGDPDEGMGKLAWKIVFPNTSKTTCSLT